jgi:hypothetical protein
MDERKRDGERCYTGAYMIRAGTGIDAGKPKHVYLVDRVFTPLWERRDEAPIGNRNCQAWSDFYKETFGMGDFMRNQVITDMKYTDYLPKEKTRDWKSFVLAGPGTRRGLNRLLDKPLATTMSFEASINTLRDLRITVSQQLIGVDISVFDDLNNLTNCLCEFDKYCRVKFDEGKRPKQRYQGAYEEQRKK